MAKNDKEKNELGVLETSLMGAMRALDNQIAREMQRTPAERDEHGVQKWEPYRKRIEDLCAFMMNSIGEGEIKLDSLLILTKANAKCLQLLMEELGPDGLGDVRSDYCIQVMEEIRECARRSLRDFQADQNIM